MLQFSELLLSLGVSVEVQENPYESPVQPDTLASALQLPPLVNPTQQ